ncbi:PAS domain S-box-containing protein [Methylohalomonas lacus]|uniref:histidine kinase n=1 Tax=Methylohalomonas lacus TaxID=398773 RepID=A0AAE3HK93_9GAMM|nr:PAS domain-containing protein [Methylohalomonas lacus]MCS3902023.1 PAS domain S-box-containing protein [Methylohalomonas lacus]
MMSSRSLAEAMRNEPDHALFALLEAIGSAVVVCDDDGRTVFANAAAHDLLGESIATATSLAGSLPAAEQASLRQLLADAAGQHDLLKRTLQFRDTGGARSRLRISVRQLPRPDRCWLICTLQPEAAGMAAPPPAVAADDTMLARLLDGFPGLAYRGRASGDWDMTLVSQGGRTLTGYPPQQLQAGGSVNYRDLIHRDDRARVWQELHSALGEQRCYQLTYRIRAGHQTEKWVWEHGVGIYDGAEPMIEGFIVDITDSKRAEFRIREGQRSLATLVSNLQGMAYRCSHTREWDMYFVSDGCAQLTGYASSELLYSRKIAYGDLVHADDRDAAVAEVERAVAEHRPFRVVYRIITAGGQEKLVWDQGSGVFAEDGSVTELEGFITELDSSMYRAGIKPDTTTAGS